MLAAALLSLALGLGVRELAGTGSATSPPQSGAQALPARAMAALPASLSGPVSAAIGADDPGYHVAASGRGLTARTPAQHLSASFGTTGVVVGSAKQHLSLGLRAVGFGTALAPVAAVAPADRPTGSSSPIPG